MQLLPPQQVDPNVPAQIPADRLQDFKGFLDVVLDTVVGGAAPDVLTLGHQLWGGLAAIVVAWSGLKIAYSGTLEPWALVRIVLAVAIPRTLLHYYSVPIPGVGFTFPAMVAAGGIWLQNLFISDVVSVGYTEMTALVRAFVERLGAAWSGGSLMTIVTEGLNVFFSSLVALMMSTPLVLGLVALFCLTYTGALMGTGSSDPAELGLWVVVLLPLVVSGLMAGLKVGELAAMLVSGSGSVGSGLMAVVVRGGGRLAAAANPARPPVPGG